MITKLVKYYLRRKKAFKENQQLNYVIDYLKKDNRSNLVIIDLGFNVGRVYRAIDENVKYKKYWGFEIQKDLYEKSKDFNNTSLEVIHGAVTDFEGDTSYHEPLKWSPNSKNYKGGSTLMQDKTNSSNHAISVRAIDLAEWLVKNIEDNDQVFMKVDIEGAEYHLLEHLIVTGKLSVINSIAIEWHSNKFGLENEAQYLARKNIIKLKIWESGIRYFEWF